MSVARVFDYLPSILLIVVCSLLPMSTLACRFTICVMPPRRFFNNQMNEVIDFICLHQSNALALIELTHAIQEHFHELFLGESLIRVDAHDVLSPFPCEGHEATLTMINLHGDLQEERIGRLWCYDVVHGINTECVQCGNAEMLECISHESHIEYIVQFVVFTPCLNIEGLSQLYHVIIFVLWHHFSFHIINALFTRRNDGSAQ